MRLPGILAIVAVSVVAVGAGGAALVRVVNRPVAAPTLSQGAVPCTEARALIEAACAGIVAGDGSALDRAIDMEFAAHQAAHEAGLPQREFASYMQGVRSGLAKQGELSLGNALSAAFKGGHARVLRCRQVDGRTRVLARFHLEGVNYLEFHVARNGRGTRIIDFRNYQTCMVLSEAMRVQIAAMLGSIQRTGLLARRGGDPEQIRLLADLPRLRRLAAAGKPGEALAAIDAMPERVRRQHLIAISRAEFAQATSPADYDRVNEEHVRFFGHLPELAFMLFDAHFAAGRHDQAVAALRTVQRDIDCEGWLPTLEATTLRQSGDADGALRAARTATDREPELALAWLAVASAASALRSFDAAADALAHVEKLTPLDPAGMREDKDLAAFLDSDRGKAWLSARR